ncbi:MAG: hypothetical protein D6E12_08965 [Desulfovibrio sp.]|nr:MAG: hypothetical protein D6E12_08965 [Desulfovibrio sp.]
MPRCVLVSLACFLMVLFIAPTASAGWLDNAGSVDPVQAQGRMSDTPARGGQEMPSGFIGSLLSGEEFTGLNILDFLALGMIIFFVARMLGRSNVDQDGNPKDLDEDSDAFRRARSAWKFFEGDSQDTDTAERKAKVSELRPDPAPPQPPQAPSPSDAAQAVDTSGFGPDYIKEMGGVPQDFNVSEFMEGAKLVFARLQDSLAQGDLEDIQEFAVGSALVEFSQRIKSQSQSAPVTVTSLGGRLLGVTEHGDTLEAEVYFDAILSRGRDRSSVREIWRFRKPADDAKAMWLLEDLEAVQ